MYSFGIFRPYEKFLPKTVLQFSRFCNEAKGDASASGCFRSPTMGMMFPTPVTVGIVISRVFFGDIRGKTL